MKFFQHSIRTTCAFPAQKAISKTKTVAITLVLALFLSNSGIASEVANATLFQPPRLLLLSAEDEKESEDLKNWPTPNEDTVVMVGNGKEEDIRHALELISLDKLPLPAPPTEALNAIAHVQYQRKMAIWLAQQILSLQLQQLLQQRVSCVLIPCPCLRNITGSLLRSNTSEEKLFEALCYQLQNNQRFGLEERLLQRSKDIAWMEILLLSHYNSSPLPYFTLQSITSPHIYPLFASLLHHTLPSKNPLYKDAKSSPTLSEENRELFCELIEQFANENLYSLWTKREQIQKRMAPLRSCNRQELLLYMQEEPSLQESLYKIRKNRFKRSLLEKKINSAPLLT